MWDAPISKKYTHHRADRRVCCQMRKPTPPKRPSRSRDADRRRFERSAELYLHACYGAKTAARADQFAEFLRVTRPYLSRIVPELIGMPLRDFLRREQLAHARHLLRTTPLTIDQIALASAFGTPWTFYRRFKAAFGMTPGEYRLGVEAASLKA
jgi:AraC-like DNA-binding protein